ncbi:hypothetical protein ACIPSA_44730 [Streptomyces sp. NPDC086549]|uniref:hypothetical protein n=1 Tax=Streptomyces sp. NPDC086549 TaxID=3365752 RepID=UPI0037F58ED9
MTDLYLPWFLREHIAVAGAGTAPIVPPPLHRWRIVRCVWGRTHSTSSQESHHA